MILINEWLPNPKGTDTPGEWVELRNSGKSSVDLKDWKLTTDGKKFFTLSGVVKSEELFVIYRSQSKVALKNKDGALALYDEKGKLADQVSFLGSAPEGESANRAQFGFFFTQPTPGKVNAAPKSNALTYDKEYSLGVPLNKATYNIGLAGSLLGTALALAAAVVFILKSHEGLSHLFFQRN